MYKDDATIEAIAFCSKTRSKLFMAHGGVEAQEAAQALAADDRSQIARYVAMGWHLDAVAIQALVIGVCARALAPGHGASQRVGLCGARLIIPRIPRLPALPQRLGIEFGHTATVPQSR